MVRFPNPPKFLYDQPEARKAWRKYLSYSRKKRVNLTTLTDSTFLIHFCEIMDEIIFRVPIQRRELQLQLDSRKTLINSIPDQSQRVRGARLLNALVQGLENLEKTAVKKRQLALDLYQDLNFVSEKTDAEYAAMIDVILPVAYSMLTEGDSHARN